MDISHSSLMEIEMLAPAKYSGEYGCSVGEAGKDGDVSY
jgi:hypothetical protein